MRRVGMPGSVCPFTWHPQLNQILVGSGGRKSGSCHILYHPTFSEKGALRAVGRAPRKVGSPSRRHRTFCHCLPCGLMRSAAFGIAEMGLARGREGTWLKPIKKGPSFRASRFRRVLLGELVVCVCTAKEVGERREDGRNPLGVRLKSKSSMTSFAMAAPVVPADSLSPCVSSLTAAHAV